MKTNPTDRDIFLPENLFSTFRRGGQEVKGGLEDVVFGGGGPGDGGPLRPGHDVDPPSLRAGPASHVRRLRGSETLAGQAPKRNYFFDFSVKRTQLSSTSVNSLEGHTCP